MKKLLYIIAALTITAGLQLFNSCKKEKTNIPSGTYSGTLTAIQVGGTTTQNIEIIFSGENFSLKGKFANSGTFKKTSKNQLVFVNHDAVPDSNFDTNLILNGSYTYETEGDRIILAKNLEIVAAVYPTPSYRYDLKQVK